jgi:exosortase/archaeosortase family protein
VTIDINETCNGLALLMAMLVIGVVFAWRTQPTIGRGAGVVALACAVGFAANWIRIIATAWIAFTWGPEAAAGPAHLLLGESVYLGTVAVFTLLVVLGSRPAPRRPNVY